MPSSPRSSQDARSGQIVRIRIDGCDAMATAGTTVAAAVLNARTDGVIRRSATGEPRGPLCGMGVCFECRVEIDGRAHQRSCMVACREGMVVTTGVASDGPVRGPVGGPVDGWREARPMTEHRAELVVIGAGPAGLSAAAAGFGQRGAPASTLLVDDNPTLGGQIWRGEGGRPQPAAARAGRWLGAPDVRTLLSTTIVQPLEPGSLLAEGPGGPVVIRYERLVLATGARERFLPFPGWTLPNITGVGGLQALVKGGLDIRGKRVVVAGSGPLLLVVGAFLRGRGATIVGPFDQAPAVRVQAFARSLWRRPGKLLQAALLRGRLLGAPYRCGWWPVRAEGSGTVERVTVTDGAGVESHACDYLACAFGLTPNTQLATMLGCRVEEGRVVVDADQQTSVPGVFAAGECCGVAGVDAAEAEGLIATGLGGREGGRQRSLRQAARRFGEELERTFALRDELKTLADERSMLCRCEDVAVGRVRPFASWREAKIQTRCGMGPCQGRICGPAAEFVLGLTPADARPPLCPVPMSSLATPAAQEAAP